MPCHDVAAFAPSTPVPLNCASSSLSLSARHLHRASLSTRRLRAEYTILPHDHSSTNNVVPTTPSSAGYQPVKDGTILTTRCDRILCKSLVHCDEECKSLVQVMDGTRYFTVAEVPRSLAFKHNLPIRAACVLVTREVQGDVLVHRRSLTKDAFAGRLSVFVTGCVDGGEHPDETAVREVGEEVGLTTGLHFTKPFHAFVNDARSSGGEHERRIVFHPYVAEGAFELDDLVCEADEVDEVLLMGRAEIEEREVGGSLWHAFRAHAL